jgi:hypothetical protein
MAMSFLSISKGFLTGRRLSIGRPAGDVNRRSKGMN